MTPIITLWTDATLNKVASDVALSLESSGYGENLYRSIDCSALSKEELASMIHRVYRELITLDNTDSTLHAVAVLPLYNNNAVEIAKKLIEAVVDAGANVSLDIIGLQSGISAIINAEETPISKLDRQAGIDEIMQLIGNATFACSLMPLDDYAANGASAGFSQELLSHFLSCFLGALIENYGNIIMPAFGAESKHNLLAFGLARLEFRRKEVTDYLVHRAFVEALERDGITVENIDIQNAAQRAFNALQGIDKFFDEFYNKNVQPLIDQKISDSQIAAQLSAPIKECVDALSAKLTDYFNNPNLSLPDKEATLALILGRDNRRLKGTLYHQDGLLVDDALEKPIKLYIDTYNQLAPGSEILPKRGAYDELAFISYDDEGNIIEDERNNLAFYPLNDIKRIKNEIIDLTSYIRSNSERLEKLLNNLEEERIAGGHLSEEGFITPGIRNRVFNTIPEQPLEETYRPVNIKPAQSVDLRKYFSEIRNQLNVGSCSTFATISMYEYLINRTLAQTGTKLALSEGFLFYYTNVVTGKEEGGSNYFDQFAAMSKFGSCAQALYPYNAECVNIAPIQEAITDALKHRIVKAKQLSLESGANKYNSIVKNHILITSALTEGYPVGISLKLFDDFGSGDGGYVPRPTEAQIKSGESQNHAMVIVGYSNESKCYIVRNSWGKDWGDNGYCYISSSYIDDAELNNFACIITETIEGTIDVNEKTPQLVAPLAGTHSQIAAASIRNALDESEIRLQSLNSTYSVYYRYYQDLLIRLKDPGVKNVLQQLESASLSDTQKNAETIRLDLIDKYSATLKNYCHGYIAKAVKLSLFTLLAIIIVGFLAYYRIYESYSLYYSLAAVILTVITVITWINYSHFRRKKRMELDEEIENAARLCQSLTDKLNTIKLKFYVSGILIDNVLGLIDKLDDKYRRIVSYNNNLLCWYEEDKKRAAEIQDKTRIATKNCTAMFIALTDPDILDNFFSKNRHNIINSIDFIDAFGNYELSAESMKQVRNLLEQQTRASIDELTKEFNMLDYLTQSAKYSFVPPVNTSQTMRLINRLATVLTRNSDTTSTSETRYVIINCGHDRIEQWRSTINPMFSFQPLNCRCKDDDSMTLLTLKFLNPAMLI